MDCSPLGSSVHRILQARVLEWGCHALLQGVFQTQGSNPSLLYLLRWQGDSLPLLPPGKSPYYIIQGQKDACKRALVLTEGVK